MLISRSKNVCINISNIHLGGGISVASSFLSELVNFKLDNFNYSILVSSKIYNNLPRKIINKLKKKKVKFKIVNIFQFQPKLTSLILKKNFFDIVFTVLGPLYSFSKKHKNIVGFAQAWIIYPNNECYKLFNLLEFIKVKIKFWIQSQFFKRADLLIVELNHVKIGLIKELGVASHKIKVVRNCVSSIYANPVCWKPIPFFDTKCDLKIGFLGRNYLHKNTVIFPEVAKTLKDKYRLDVKFFVTFTKLEWQLCADEFRKYSYNLGELKLQQCPTFYKLMDVIVFPSLLESSSVMPLEAMAMKKPLFVSDRPFNRELCNSHAYYFDPLSPVTLADKIKYYMDFKRDDKKALKFAKDYSLSFSNPKIRAKKYLEIIDSYCKKKFK